MKMDIITMEDLRQFKTELLQEMKGIIRQGTENQQNGEWLRERTGAQNAEHIGRHFTEPAHQRDIAVPQGWRYHVLQQGTNRKNIEMRIT